MIDRRKFLQKIGVVAAAPAALLAGEVAQPELEVVVGRALPEGISAEAIAEALRLARPLGEFRP